MNITANRGQLKQIVIPKQLQSLKASTQMRSQSISLEKTSGKANRAKSQMQAQKRPELPRIQAEKLPSDAYDTGLAIKLLPVDYYIKKTHGTDDFIKVVDQVEQELTNVYNTKNELISGQALTQFWSSVDQNRDELQWIDCDVLAKIDSDKFLVFISAEHVYKVVSNANIIFKNATMQQPTSKAESSNPDEPLRVNLVDLLAKQQKPETNEYLIRIFERQRQNMQLQKRFETAVTDFGRLSIELAKEQLKNSVDLSAFAVACLNSKAGLSVIRGLHGAGNATGETLPAPTTEQAQQLRQAEKLRIFQCTRLHGAAIEKIPAPSSATILCTEAIAGIEFDKIFIRSTSSEDKNINICCLGAISTVSDQNEKQSVIGLLPGPQQPLGRPNAAVSAEQRDLQHQVCTSFLQHAQLTDSQLEILSRAYEDVEHPLHWCSDYLALFLWSSYRFYQVQGRFRDYCYGLGGAALTDEARAVMEKHRLDVENIRSIVGKHLASMQNPKFQQLAQCVYKTYADHRQDILFGALRVVPALWKREHPYAAAYILGGAANDMSNDASASATVFADFDCSPETPFRATFYEKLINAHKLVYQLIAPHLVDQIVNDFAGTVINAINTRLFQYQSQHGKQPSIALQDEFTKQSYAESLKLFKQIFKVIEIKYLNLFVDDLYTIAVPQWFYFLLALLHGYSRNREETRFQRDVSAHNTTGTELLKLINLTPNTQSFYENVFQDIDSLNTQSDFELPKSKQLITATLSALSQLEFNLVPINGDNFVEGLKIVPDPLLISQDLEKCIEDLAIYYSSSPKFVNSLVYDYHSSAAHNSYTIEQREYEINPNEITYKEYLQLIYTGQQLTDNANQNPFDLNFESEKIQTQLKEKAESRREKRLHQNQDIIDKISEDDIQREIDADEKQLRTETKFTEVTYYYSSRLIKKMVKISKLAGDKLKKYFDVFIRYFSLHIKKTQSYVERLFDKNKIFPPEIAMQLNGYDELLVHVDLEKFLKQKMQAEERARHKLKQLTQFLQMPNIHQMFTKIYITGEGPQQIIIDILNTTVEETLKTLQNIYDNIYQIMSLPGHCYYSTAHINITQLLTCLQQTDRLLFDFYSERLQDYIFLIINVLCDNLSQITRNLNVVYFENMNQIGELYKMYKLFMQNKDTWMNVFIMIQDKLYIYESIPLGSLSSKYYEQMLAGYIKLRKQYRDTYTEMQRITTKVVTAFNISKTFIQSIQTYFELIINNEIYNRAHEYIKLSQEDWENISQDQIGFAKKFPLINKDIQFPKPIKQIDENNNVVDFKQLRKDIEAKFGYNIFTVIQKQIKIRIFERTEQNFKRQAMSEVFYELEDLIDKTIVTLQYLNDLQVQLLYVQPNQQIQFDKIDEMIFNNQQQMDLFIKQLKNHGEVITPNKSNIDQIIDNMDIQGTTQLSRLKSLHIVFSLLSQLIVMATNFQQQFQIWKKQSISLLYADDVRNTVIDQIKVCLKTLEYFQPIKHKISSFAQNLIDFMVQERKNLIQMFILKASIYESSIKTVEAQDDEVVKRPQIDQLIKIDIKDFAVSSGFMKQIFQYKNIKQSDDILTSTLLEQMGDQKANMYLHLSDCQKMVRFEKLQQYYNAILSKMVQQPAEYGIFTPDFKIIKLNHLSSLTINDYTKTEQIKSALGDEPGYIQQYYDVYYYQDDYSSQLPFINIAQNHRHIHYTGNQKLYYFLLENIQFIMKQVETQTINVQHGYQLIGQLSCMKQFYQLLAECYRYIQHISMLNDLSSHCRSSAFSLRQLTMAELQKFTNELENLQVHIQTCFTTYSNAQQYVSRRFNREKLFDSVCALKGLFNGLFEVTSGYYNSQGVPREQIIQLLLELTYYGIFATPVVQSQKFYNGCLIFWPPDEVNESLSALLRYFGINDCSLALVNYSFKKKDSGRSINRYYIDGVMSSQGYYYKFVYPIQFDNLYTMYLQLNEESLQNVFRMTLEFHMAYWSDLIFNPQVDIESGAELGVTFTQDNLDEILKYPPIITYSILSQILVTCYDKINYGCSDVSQYKRILELLEDLLVNKINGFQHTQVNVDFDSILEQVQLSMLTTLENYFFNSQISILNNYPAIPPIFVKQAEEERQKAEEEMQKAQQQTIQKKSLQEMLDTDEGNADTADDEKSDSVSSIFSVGMSNLKHKRLLMSPTFNKQDFRYLSQIQDQKIQSEHLQVLVYIHKTCQQIIQTFNANSVYGQICLIYTQNGLDYLTQIVTSEINRQQKLKNSKKINKSTENFSNPDTAEQPRSKSKKELTRGQTFGLFRMQSEAFMASGDLYESMLYYKMNSLVMPALMIQPKFYICTATEYIDQLNTTFRDVPGLLCQKLFLYDDIIVVLPKGYSLGQKFYNFINDIMGTALQTNATYLDVSSERIRKRLHLFKDQNCLLILANYNSVTPENMSRISEFCLESGSQKRKCKVIHLLQSGIINQIGQNIMDAHGLYCVQQINQQDQTNNIVYMSQFNYVCQAQAITFKLTQHFHQTIVCQEILTVIFQSTNAQYQPQILAQLINNKFPDKKDITQQLINEMFDKQIELNYNTQLFVYQALALFDKIKYNNSGKPASQQSKDERLNKHLTRLMFLEEDIIQKSMFTQLGFQYVTEVLYLLLELNIEKLGIYDDDMMYIIIQQFDYLFRNIVQQQIDLQYILIQDENDVKYYDNGEFIINNQAFYFIVYDKLISSRSYRNVIQNFLLQPKPSNVFIFVYSNDYEFTNANVQYYQHINSTNGIIDIPLFIKNTLEQNIHIDSQNVSINNIMSKKSSLTITEFDYLINNFNIDSIRIQRIQWMQDFAVISISQLFIYCTDILFGIHDLKDIIETMELFLSELQIAEFLEIYPKTLSNDDDTSPVKLKQYRYQLKHILYVTLALTQTTGFSYSFLLNLISHAAFTACYLHYFAGNKEQNIKQQSMLLQNYKTIVSQLTYENKSKITPQFQILLEYMESKKVDMDEFGQMQFKTYNTINTQIRQQSFQANKFKFFQFKNVPVSLFPLNKILLNIKNQEILSATNEITQQKFEYQVYYDYLPLINVFGDVKFNEEESQNPEEEKQDVFLTQQDDIPSRIQYIYNNMLERNIKPEYMMTMAVQMHLLYAAINFSKPSQIINSNVYLTELILENSTISQMLVRMSYINHKSMYYNRPNVDYRRVSYIIQCENDIKTLFTSLRPFFELNDSLGIAQFSPFTSIRLYISSTLTREQISELEHFAVSNVLKCMSDYGEEKNYKTQNVITIFIGENQYINNDHVNLIDFRQYEGDDQRYSDIYSNNLNKFYGKAITAAEIIMPHMGQSIDIYKQPFFEACSIGLQQLNHPVKEDYLMKQLINMYNFNSYCQYKNSLIQYLFKDISRSIYPDMYKAHFEKFIKNDKQIKYDFNKDLMNDAAKLSFFQLLPGSLSIHMPIPITIVTHPTISYDAFVQNIQMISRSTTNMMQDMSKPTSLKTLCIDFFSLAWQASNYKYGNKQVFSNMVHQSTETQIYMCFKNIICYCLRLQKLLSTEKSSTDKNTFSNTASIWSLNYHGQNVNFDASRVSQFLKSSYFYQYILMFPISLLLRFNIMSQILQLSFPDNDINHFFNYNNLSDVQVEAAGYMGYEFVNIQTINMLLSQRMQIYIYDDIGYCQNPKFIKPCHVNVIQFQYIECQSQLLFQELINIKVVKQLYTQNDSVMQATIQAFQDFTLSDQRNEIVENVKLNHILYLIFQELNNLGEAASAINPCHLIRCSRQLCHMFEKLCGHHLETVNALLKKANFLMMLFENMAEEQQQIITQIDQLYIYNQNLDKEIQQEVEEQQSLQKQINVIQQSNPIQSVYNNTMTQIQQEKQSIKNRMATICGQLRELAKRIVIKEAPTIKAEQLYVLQMLLNTYNQGQNFDNYNENYKAVTKQQYVAHTLTQIGPDLVSGYFTQSLASITPESLQLQQKLKLQDAIQKCPAEVLEIDTGNQYVNLTLQFVKEFSYYVNDNAPALLQLYEKRDGLQKDLDEFKAEIQRLQMAINRSKGKQQSMQKQKDDGQQSYASAISTRDQALKRQNLVDILQPRVKAQTQVAKDAIILQRIILRLKEWTSAFLAVYLMGGFKMMKTILDKYVNGVMIPGKSMENESVENHTDQDDQGDSQTSGPQTSLGICIICQRHQLPCCNICQKCTCLCSCHYEFDKFQQERLVKDSLDGTIPHQKIDHFLQSKQIITGFMQQFNLRPNNNKLLSDFVNSHDSTDIQEMNGLVFLASCFDNEVLLVSRKNYQNIIDILQASDANTKGEVVEYIDYDVHNFISFQDVILKLLQRDKTQTVVILAKQMTHDLLFIINKLVSINLNIEIGNTQFSLLLATTMFKLSGNTKKIRYYLVLEQQSFPKMQIMNNVVNNALTVYNNRCMSYDKLVFNQSIFMDNQKALQDIIKQQKQQLQRHIVYMHYPQLPKEMAQVLYEANSNQLNRIKQLSSLSAVVQDVSQNNINTQLTAIRAESDEYESNFMNMNKQKEKYTKLFQQYSMHLASPEIQTDVDSYYQICIQLARFAIYYPQVIQILSLTENPLDNDLGTPEKVPDGVQAVKQQLLERSSMDMLALRIQIIHNKTQFQLSSTVLNQLIVYSVFIAAYYQQNLSEDEYKFSVFCFANIGKRNIKEIFKMFQFDFCQEMLSWTSKYSTEFETISQQKDVVKYVKTYYKQNLLPQCLQSFNLKTLCLTFAVQLVCNTEQTLDQQCQQLIELICPKQVQRGVKFKDVVLYIKQLLNQYQQEESEEKPKQDPKTVLILTSDGKIVAQIVKSLIEDVNVRVVQGLDEIDFQVHNTVYMMSNKRQSLYNQKFFDLYYQNISRLFMVTTDGYQYEYDDTVTRNNDDDDEESEETSSFRIMSTQVIRALPQLVTQYNRNYGDQNIKIGHLHANYTQRLQMLQDNAYNISQLFNEYTDFINHVKRSKFDNSLQFMKKFNALPLALQNIFQVGAMFAPLDEMQLIQQIVNNRVNMAGNEVLIRSVFKHSNCYLRNILITLKYKQSFQPLQYEKLYKNDNPFNQTTFQTYIKQPRLLPFIFERSQLNELICIDTKKPASGNYIKCMHNDMSIYLQKGNTGTYNAIIKQDCIRLNINTQQQTDFYYEEAIQQ